MMQKASNLYQKLQKYQAQNHYPFHMPGHKRFLGYEAEGDLLKQIAQIDITEIDGFDNLHDATEILAEIQEEIAEICGSRKSYLVVGGSTTSILAALSAAVPMGSKILMARNCHKAVYHAVYLRKLRPNYLYPKLEESCQIALPMTADQVEKALREDEEVKAVVLTSPTYEGLVSEIEAIAKITKRYDIPLLVDEAHGAHFSYSGELPSSAIAHADIVMQSLHKTTAAMTQSALLHLNSDRINPREIQRYLDIYMTSSPSYVLMASMQEAILDYHSNGQAYGKRLWEFRNQIKEAVSLLSSFHVYESENELDPGKVVIYSHWMTGKELYELLIAEYQIQMEMCQANYVVAILTPYDTAEGITRLMKALQDIEHGLLKEKRTALKMEFEFTSIRPKKAEEIWESWDEGEKTELDQSLSKVSSNFVYLYPPGIPILVPGEIWDQELITYIKNIIKKKYVVLGTELICEKIYTQTK